MKIKILLVLLVLSLLSCDTIKEAGPTQTKTHNVSAIADEIEVSNALDVTFSDEINKGEMIITASENIFQYIIIDNNSEKLSVQLSPNHNYKKVKVEVLLPSSQYNGITIENACNVSVEGALLSFDEYELEISDASCFEGKISAHSSVDLILTDASNFNGDIVAGNSIELNCSDASELTGRLQAANNIDIVSSDASSLKISGTTAQCNIKASDAVFIKDTDLICDHLIVDLSNASKVRMSVEESINGKVSNASTLEYKGNPTVNVETSGASTVKKI